MEMISVPFEESWHCAAHKVQIEAQGNSIKISLDGQVMIETTDDEFAAGTIGLRLWDGAESDFENLSITTLNQSV